MSDSNIENTQPTQPAIEQTMPARIDRQPAGQPVGDTAPTPIKPPKTRRWPWILLGVFVVLLLGGAGTVFGYQAALKARDLGLV